MTRNDLKKLIQEVIEEIHRHEEEYTMAFPLSKYAQVKKLFETLLKKKLIYAVYVPTIQLIKDDPESFNARVGKEGWFDVSFTADYYDLKKWGPQDISDWCDKNGIETR